MKGMAPLPTGKVFGRGMYHIQKKNFLFFCMKKYTFDLDYMTCKNTNTKAIQTTKHETIRHDI